MPIFEYACRACGHQFEYLTRGSQTPSCPTCSAVDLQKLQSTFAVSANGGSTSPREAPQAAGGCGMCGDPRGPGACSMN